MIPPVFAILNASSVVKNLLGASPLRVFPWGAAPQTTAKPYATYTVYNGLPENSLSDTPDMDALSTQIDVWAESVDSCLAVAEAVRNVIEPYAHLTSFSSISPDEDTELFRQRMDFDFFTER